MGTIYTKEDYKCEVNPKVKNLDTKVLQEFYEHYLVSNIFIFVLEDESEIRLTFEEANFLSFAWATVF